MASSLFFSLWSQTLYESTDPLNVTALGDKSELMRQSFVSQVPCKDFVFSGKIRLSSEMLAESFVFPACFRPCYISGWSVVSDCWIVVFSHLCVQCPHCSHHLCFGAVIYGRLLRQSQHDEQELYQHLGLDATNWKKVTCSSHKAEQRERKEGMILILLLSVRMSYPVSYPLTHVHWCVHMNIYH